MHDRIMIETQELTKVYGSITAVDHLNLTISKGEIFGLLGPNGAGKTTTILMLMGLSEPTSGSIRVAGLDPVRQPLKVKAMVGYMPDNMGFYSDMTGREFHSGIDIAQSKGAPVRASNSGTVTFAGWRGGYGNLVIVNHGGGIETYYAHNSSITVSVGKQVEKGQQIATVGSTGRSSGSHVHFEIRVNSSPVNPLNYLNK
jgi:murein DD-endopeptidase MepM/ murein hydrolase activator NlpD